MRAKDFTLEAKPLAPLEIPTPAQSTVEKSVKMANHIDKVLDQYEIKKSIIQQEIDRLKDQIEALKYAPPEGSTVKQKGTGWVGRDREGRPIGGGPIDEISKPGVEEAFNQPYATDLEKSEHDDYDSLVQLPDGSHLSVMFNNQGDGEYQVEFWRGPSQGVTGEGDAQRIFATVLSTIQRFIKEHNPWRLTFSATKDVEPGQNSESRAKLYNRLVDRYAAAWGYDAYNEDHGDQVEYELTRLKPSVAEGFPNFNREWDEATRYPEFVNLGKKKWIELVSKGKQVTVTRKNVNKINNTDAADPKSFKLLDPEKQKRALAQLANGDVEMPIVARYSDGYLELIGGNTRLTAQMAKDGQAKVWLFNVPEELTQGVAEGQDDNGISFQVQKGKNKFATTLSIGNKPVGVYQYDADTGRSIAEVYPEFKGKGLGKLLVLHAIYTAAQLGLDFQEDESRTAEYDNVLDSLSSNGYIVDDDGYWYVTGEGEQYLQQSMKQGVAEATGDEKFDTMMSRMAAEPKVADMHSNMPPTSIPELLQWANKNNKPYHRKFAEWARNNNFTNVNAALEWFGDNVDPWDEFGSKEHENVFGDLVGEPLIDAAKHDPKAAELLKVYVSYEKIFDDWTDKYRQMNYPDRFGNFNEQGIAENFADGKKPGRKGLAKRMGVNTNASVSTLRNVAKHSSGEKQRMAHWMANMKSGRNKS
jgi:GNAT superfamily N-acetyltransferase